MLWQKEVQIDKLIGPSHSSESKLGWQLPGRLGRRCLPNASSPQNLPSPCCQAFLGCLLSSFLTLLQELQQVEENVSRGKLRKVLATMSNFFFFKRS